MTIRWDELDEGDPVLLRFVSHFNEDVTHTVAGVVAEHEAHDIVVRDEQDHYAVTWDGGVDKQASDGHEWIPYGGSARVWAVDPVDPIVDDQLTEDDLNKGDKRPVDPLLDDPDDLADGIYWQSEDQP